MGEKALYRKLGNRTDSLKEEGVVYIMGKELLPDAQLWSDFQSGSETAFAQLYQQYADILYGYGIKMVPRKPLVLDTIQDLFIELWEAKENLGKVQSIKAYLFISFRRRLLKKVTKQRKRFEADTNPEDISLITESEEHRLVEKQAFDADKEKLEHALADLSPKQREILHLKFHAQLNYREIAQIMDLDRKAAYNLAARVISILRRQLAPVMLLLMSIYAYFS